MTAIPEAAYAALQTAMREWACNDRFDAELRAGLEAAAPHIAAQALRDAATEMSTSTYHRECSIAVATQLKQLADLEVMQP